jgi:hypothetical protein
LISQNVCVPIPALSGSTKGPAFFVNHQAIRPYLRPLHPLSGFCCDSFLVTPEIKSYIVSDIWKT